ncbi:MAG: 5-nitroimidazole antibiotic resistance protein [Dethiosulfovibrio peptidovorans]|nr:MAG: 5-nitroimidazole antibiotic resistance protein [Dethiosulfovibrio peptidovorans]
MGNMVYRPMRRKDREVSDPRWMESVLSSGVTCYLSLFDGEWPYVIPLSYGYSEGHLYFHSAKAGKKIDIIRENPRTSFAVDVETICAPESRIETGSVPPYRSVIGYGEIEIIPDDQEDRKREALNILAVHHGRERRETPRPKRMLDRVCVLDLTIIHMTGKEKKPSNERSC